MQQNFSRKVLVPQTTVDYTSRFSKSYVPFTCKFPMVTHFVQILHRCCRSKTNFYVFSYDKTSLNFLASFRFFHAVFMEKFQKIRYLNYVRRGIRLNIVHYAQFRRQAQLGLLFWNHVTCSIESHMQFSDYMMHSMLLCSIFSLL